ncbi:MAG: glycogen phosphorylase, partial [Pseudomonadota bacterium]
MATRKNSVKAQPEPVRTGLSAEALAQAVLDNLSFVLGRSPALATPHDWYEALAYSVRDRLLERWLQSVQTWGRREVKVACYLSAEFLIGPQLGNSLL